jgi:hypothetical protein
MVSMDINKIFEDAWKLFVKDIAPLIIGAFLALLLTIVSLGILAGPMAGGLYRMVARRVREGRQADVGDVFSAFDRFWTLFAAALVISILVAIGLVFFILPGLLLAAIWLYVPLFIVDKGMGLGEAMSASRERVSANGLWLHVGIVLLIGLISAVVGNIVGIGFLLTWPLTVTFVTAMYFRAGGEDALVDAATGTAVAYAPAPPAAPQPPAVAQAVSAPQQAPAEVAAPVATGEQAAVAEPQPAQPAAPPAAPDPPAAPGAFPGSAGEAPVEGPQGDVAPETHGGAQGGTAPADGGPGAGSAR